MEFEALLRIFSSPLGTKRQLEATLDRLRREARQMTEFNDSIAQEYIEGRAPFQHEAHVRTLVVDFFTDWMATIEAWVERTAAEISEWEDLGPDPQKQARARTRLLDARTRRNRNR
jgi:anti-sigma-K factor RskA